jgi:hypothetical protein
LANVDWQQEIEHSVRIAKAIQAHLTTRHPELFPAKDVPWYQATDAEVPK